MQVTATERASKRVKKLPPDWSPRNLKLLLGQATVVMSVVLLCLVHVHSARADFQPVQGMVPRFPGARPAVDLVYDGRILSPDQAASLAAQGMDLSMLDPDASSDLWKPLASVAQDDVGIQLNRPVTYLSVAPSQPGNFRFLIEQVDATGTPRTYAVFASKVLHSMLLRKSILRKLGYQIPKTQWVPELQIQFKNLIEKEAFRVDLSQKTYGEPGRWVVSGSGGQRDLNHIRMQDLVVVENQDHTYHLANGYLDASRIRGRRLLNALLVPYALVSSQDQSINLFPWNAGNILGDNVLLPYEHADRFTPSYEDARWIARKILKLSRQDWVDVVVEAYLPSAVGRLLVEKLISRRNTLAHLLRLDQEPGYQDLAFEPLVSDGPDLVQGELTRSEFAGYATRFSAGDPQSPIDGRQIRQLFKSNLISSGVQTALSMLNSLPVFSTDINQKIEDHRKNLMIQQIEEALKSGTAEKIPLGAYAFPTWNAALIFSRDLAVGSYLGADNLLQLADSFGYSVALGAFVSVDGLPSPIDVRAHAGVSATRTFTHLQPVKTIEAAMKVPYKNAIVSRLLKQAGETLLEKVDDRFSQLPLGEQQNILKENLRAFTEDLAVGSSLMITDALDFGLGVGVTWKPYQILALGADVEHHRLVIRRLHILRKTSTEFQVYQSHGNLKDFSVSIRLELRAKLNTDIGYQMALEKMGFRTLSQVSFPILRFQARSQKGQVETDFYRFEIDPEQQTAIDLREKMGALSAVLSERDTELLRASVRPYRLKVDFRQSLTDTDFLFLSWNKIRNRSQMSILTPGGSEKTLFREYHAKTFGLDFERAAGETLSTVLQALTRLPVEVATSQSSNPGFSYLGSAKNRIWTYEEVPGQDRYLKLTEVWNGWATRQKRAVRILKTINERLGQNVFSTQALNQTQKVLLYQIRFDVHLYEAAFKAVQAWSDDQVRRLFVVHRRNAGPEKDLDIEELRELDAELVADRERMADSFLNYWRRGQKEVVRSGDQKTAKSWMHAFSMAHVELTGTGFAQLVGGENHFLTTARMDGFRVGDEAGDAPIIGNTIGSAAAQNSAGPYATIQRKSGMTEGELLVGWMLRRAL